MTTPNPCQLQACQSQPICAECAALHYCPASADPEQRHKAQAKAKAISAASITEALLAIKEQLPRATRMHTSGTIAILTLGEQIPDKADAHSAIGFIRAMVATGEKRSATRAES
jgi:hypothetical protein